MPSKKQRAKEKKAAAAAAPNDTKQPKLEGQPPQTLKQVFRDAHRAALKDPRFGNGVGPQRCKTILDNIEAGRHDNSVLYHSGPVAKRLLRERLVRKLEVRVAAIDDEADGYITQEEEVLTD